MSAVQVATSETADRLARDAEGSNHLLSERIASLLRPLTRDGISLDVEVHIRGKSVSVKVDPPPHRFLFDGQSLRRQP